MCVEDWSRLNDGGTDQEEDHIAEDGLEGISHRGEVPTDSILRAGLADVKVYQREHTE